MTLTKDKPAGLKSECASEATAGLFKTKTAESEFIQ